MLIQLLSFLTCKAAPWAQPEIWQKEQHISAESFSTSAIFALRAGRCFVWGRGYPVDVAGFSSILGLHLLDASSTAPHPAQVVTTKNVSRRSQMSLGFRRQIIARGEPLF